MLGMRIVWVIWLSIAKFSCSSRDVFDLRLDVRPIDNTVACPQLQKETIRCGDKVDEVDADEKSTGRFGYVAYPSFRYPDKLCLFERPNAEGAFIACLTKNSLHVTWSERDWNKCIDTSRELFAQARSKRVTAWPYMFFTSFKCRRSLMEFARLKVQEDEIEATRLIGLGMCGTAGDVGTCLAREFDSPAPWSSQETSASGSRRKLLWTSGYQTPFHDDKHVRVAFDRYATWKGRKLLDSGLVEVVLREAFRSQGVEFKPSLEELERARTRARCTMKGCTLEGLQHTFQQLCKQRTWPEVAPMVKGQCMAEDLLDAALPQQRIQEPFAGWLELNGLEELKGRVAVWLWDSASLEAGINQISIRNMEGMMHVELPISEFVKSTPSTPAHWKYLSKEGSGRLNFSFDGPTDRFGSGSKHCGDKFEIDVSIGLELIGLSTIEEYRLMGFDLSMLLAQRLRASMIICLRIPETELDLDTVTNDDIKELFDLGGHADLITSTLQTRNATCPRQREECWVDIGKLNLGIEVDFVKRLQTRAIPTLQRQVFKHVLLNMMKPMSMLFLGKIDSALHGRKIPLEFYHCRNPDEEDPKCSLTVPHLYGRSTNTLREAAEEHGTVPGWTAFLGARADRAPEKDCKALHDCASKSICDGEIIVAWKESHSRSRGIPKKFWAPASPAFWVVQQSEQPQFWHLWMEWADRDLSDSVSLKELSFLIAALDVKYGERIDNLLMLKLTPSMELTGHNDNVLSRLKLGPSEVAKTLQKLASSLDGMVLSNFFMPALTRLPGNYPPHDTMVLESEGRDVDEGFGPLPSAELVRPVSMPADIWADFSIKKLLPSTGQLGYLKHTERRTAKGLVKDVTSSMGLDLNMDYIFRTFVSGKNTVDYGYVFSSAPMRWGKQTVIAVVNCNTLRIFEAAPVFTDEASCHSLGQTKPVGTVCFPLSTSTGKIMRGTCQRAAGDRIACATSWRPVVHHGSPQPLHEQPLEQVFELWMLNLGESVVKDQGTRTSETGPYVEGGFAKCARSPDINWGMLRGTAPLDFASPDHDPMCGTAPELADVMEGSEMVKPKHSHRAFKELLSLFDVGWSTSLADLSSDLWEAVQSFALQDLSDGQCLISPVNHAFVEELGKLGKIDPTYFRFGWKTSRKAGFQWLCLRELESGPQGAVQGLFEAIARQVQRNLLPAVERKSSGQDAAMEADMGGGWEPSSSSDTSIDFVIVGKDAREFSVTGRVQTETDQYGMDMNPLTFTKPSARLEGQTIEELGWTVLPSHSIKKRMVSPLASSHDPPIQASISDLGKKFMATRTELWTQVRQSTGSSFPFAFSIANRFDELILLAKPATLPKCKYLLPKLVKEGTPCGRGCMCWSSCASECTDERLDLIEPVKVLDARCNLLKSLSLRRTLCVGRR